MMSLFCFWDMLKLFETSGHELTPQPSFISISKPPLSNTYISLSF
ncbi:hypothetical protein VCHA39O220_20309 [Vibrio chagasii]|nr:hypothetical protein VCHA54P489_10097 [Vibrio chagasii]CAH7156043.1 hypothetical protein VCHA39O220_20309 [Vibrio chagasii]CAH7208041.1 hypothetical protein VCHA37P202_20001 [Vibrio chagasii]CAH7311811.1 hypothetical protein VCHA49P380_30265 [Vibrio chagasii]CAH7464115.1 hypothetical protein VCHA39O224_50001 [Vibrio chagasii]